MCAVYMYTKWALQMGTKNNPSIIKIRKIHNTDKLSFSVWVKVSVVMNL